MHLRKALKFILYTNYFAALVTLVAAYYFKQSTPHQFSNVSSIVALSLCGIGCMMLRGAKVGAGCFEQERVESVMADRGGYRRADLNDMAAGLSYGLLILVAGLIWLGITVLVYQLFK